MKLVLEDMVSALRDDAGIAAAIGTKIYLGVCPASAEPPYLVYSISSTERPQSHDQRITSTRRKADLYSISLTVVGLNGDNCLDIAALVDNCLDGRRDLDNTEVILLEDMSVGAEFRDNDSSEILHIANLTFNARRKPIA